MKINKIQYLILKNNVRDYKIRGCQEVIIHLRGQRVIMASEVASLYGVHTRRVNEAVKNNPDKFPDGFIIELTREEKTEVVENFDHLRKLKFSSQTLKAFTEKGLYMLATILKSPKLIAERLMEMGYSEKEIYTIMK